MVTAAWIRDKIDKREQRLKAESEARGEARILALLDDDTRKQIESKLTRDVNPKATD